MSHLRRRLPSRRHPRLPPRPQSLQTLRGQLGQNNARIHCFGALGCNAPFRHDELKGVLPQASFNLYERLLQRLEIREAAVADLEYCPKCQEYAVIMEGGADLDQWPLFQCENVEGGCGKLSCRACKEEAHIGATCEEERDRIQRERGIEDIMSEAMMRRCPGCNTPMVKELGCNHMVCANCQVHLCYTCRKDITEEEYRHFHPNVRFSFRASPDPGSLDCGLTERV
ncbi:hypothetical protein BKA70DRAFT_310027 [Coprinopsis sp. MPI-PUGE-AT-0042]|nr:hypothetical protein BKA70DRAFT_310027 [Coprinopsis sp. MPI-PUGE-AT-0042]